jgi:hypothetical protein
VVSITIAWCCRLTRGFIEPLPSAQHLSAASALGKSDSNIINHHCPVLHRPGPSAPTAGIAKQPGKALHTALHSITWNITALLRCPTHPVRCAPSSFIGSHILSRFAPFDQLVIYDCYLSYGFTSFDRLTHFARFTSSTSFQYCTLALLLVAPS